jgi:hypothetical protein
VRRVDQSPVTIFCWRVAITTTRYVEFHVLELPNLNLATTDRHAKLERWARFLRARKVEELSSDPEARRLASERETADLMHGHLMASSFEYGEAKGRAEEKALGVLDAFDARDIPVSSEHRARILACCRWLPRSA